MTPAKAGEVLSVNRANNTITLDNTSTNLPATGTEAYIMLIKN